MIGGQLVSIPILCFHYNARSEGAGEYEGAGEGEGEDEGEGEGEGEGEEQVLNSHHII